MLFLIWYWVAITATKNTSSSCWQFLTLRFNMRYLGYRSEIQKTNQINNFSKLYKLSFKCKFKTMRLSVYKLQQEVRQKNGDRVDMSR